MVREECDHKYLYVDVKLYTPRLSDVFPEFFFLSSTVTGDVGEGVGEERGGKA